MTFTVKRALTGNQFVVSGTDRTGVDNKVTLTSDTWAAVLDVEAFDKANKKYNKATLKFFKPLTKAADKAKAETARPGAEFATTVVVKAKDGVDGEEIVHDAHGVILNILSQGKSDLLEWVGNELIATQ